MSKKVFIVKMPSHFELEYDEMFKERGWEIVTDLSQANLVQFTGGADVSPSLYKSTTHPTTRPYPKRDAFETVIFHKAVKMMKPMAGICRGGQFLNVMCGGQMWQDVNNHTGSHYMTDVMTGRRIMVTSTHHQMMIPTSEALILGVAKESTRKEKMMDHHLIVRTYGKDGAEDDIEAVLYFNQQALCFQPHPEFMEGEMQDLYFEYIHDYLV